MISLHGVVVPIVTPLTSERDIDPIGTQRLVDYLIGEGVHALFALGSTGEFASLPWAQQLRFLEYVVRFVNGRLPVCAGVSSNCMQEVIERAGQAAAIGADVAVMLTPFYFRASQPELTEFFVTIADRSPVPVVPYNMPFRTNNNLEPETVSKLAEHGNIIAIKDTTSDMARVLDILERVRGRRDFSYLQGNELLAVPSITFGARGLVPSIGNFAPGLMVEAYQAAAARETEKLSDLQARIQRLMGIFGLLEARPQQSTTLRLQAVKLILELNYICGSTMAQLSGPPTPEEIARVRAFMMAEGLLVSRLDHSGSETEAPSEASSVNK